MRFRVAFVLASIACFVFVLPAGASSPGEVAWHDEVHISDGGFSPGVVEVAAGRVVTVGTEVTTSGGQNIRLRAYSTKGTLLWDTTYDRNGGYEFVGDVFVTPKDIYVVGGAQASPAGNVDGLVLRYDAKTGTLIYASWYDRAGGEDAFAGVDISGKQLVVTGQSQSSATGDFDVVVAGFGTKDGAQLWTDLHDATGGFDSGSDVAIAGAVAVSAGYQTGTDNFYDLVVMGHDIKSGSRLWTATYDGAGGGPTRGHAVANSGSVVYVVGDEGGTTSTDMMVRAYESSTGSVLWSDAYDVAGFYDSAVDVDVGGGVVVATGQGRPALFSPDVLSRAFDATTGTVLWTDQYDHDGTSDQAFAVDIAGPVAVAVGSGYDDTNDDHEWVVRTLDLATGSLNWSEVHDRSGGTDSARDVAVAGTNVYVVGFTQELGTGFPGEHTDGTIRTYLR